jgi:putative transposase
MPEKLGMDNAAEFHSPVLEAALRKHGCDPHWRKIGKKHMGGTIESLIGTLMTTSVHFLPGTTYSNVKQRGEYDSEKHSALTFKEFCAWFAGQVLIYHGTVHSELRKSPKDAWEEFYSHKTMALPPMIINKRNLYIDFLPERHKPVRNSGITINAGVYYVPELAIKQGKGKTTVKYDPNDMTHIWAKIHDDYIRVPLIRSTHNFINYEYYRVDRAFNQGRPAGTITDPEALQQMIKNNELVKRSKKKTQQKKRETTQTEAQRQHKDRFSSGVPKQIPINDEYHQVLARQPNDAVNFSKPPALFDDKD